ncbi:MAG: replicative helicase loader/inhibitor [Clostridia bacterium]
MARNEIIQILTLLAGNYESFAKRTETDEQVEIMINTWQECLGDLDYKLVLQAVKKTIIESPYPPTIHDIRKNAVEMVNPTKNNALSDWDECYKMICNGNYMTQEEFDKHSDTCKRFLGSLSQLRAYSRNEDFNMDVVRSNFLKQYENLIKRNQEQKLLPQNMKDFIGQLAEKMSVKQLGE